MDKIQAQKGKNAQVLSNLKVTLDGKPSQEITITAQQAKQVLEDRTHDFYLDENMNLVTQLIQKVEPADRVRLKEIKQKILDGTVSNAELQEAVTLLIK